MAQTARAAPQHLVGRAEMEEAQRSWAVRSAPAANRAQGGVLRRARAAQVEAARRRLALGAHWLAAAGQARVEKRVLEALAAPAAKRLLEARPARVGRSDQGERQAPAANRVRQGRTAPAAAVPPGVPQAEAPAARATVRPAALVARLGQGVSRRRVDPLGRRTSGTCRSFP